MRGNFGGDDAGMRAAAGFWLNARVENGALVDGLLERGVTCLIDGGASAPEAWRTPRRFAAMNDGFSFGGL